MKQFLCARVPRGLDGIPPPQDGDLFVVLDLETTGLEPENGRVIEIGAIRANPDVTTQATFQTLVNPGIPISRKITQITGLTRRQIEAEGEDPSDVFPQLDHFIGTLPVVAYNAPFDMGFLLAEYERAGVDRTDLRFVDVLDLARQTLQLPSYKLSDVASHLGVDVKPNHRALDDAHATLLVYDRLLTLAR